MFGNKHEMEIKICADMRESLHQVSHTGQMHALNVNMPKYVLA